MKSYYKYSLVSLKAPEFFKLLGYWIHGASEVRYYLVGFPGEDE